MNRKFFIGGNWKMNGDLQLLATFSESSQLSNACSSGTMDIVICPPFPFLLEAKRRFSQLEKIEVGAQNCHVSEKGAFTGEVSWCMLEGCAIKWLILGHSERRSLFGESSAMVGEKLAAVLSNSPNLRVILCVGETELERESSLTESVLESQLLACQSSWKNWPSGRIVIAYEPVWAIGTGKVASPAQAQQVHQHLRQFLSENLGTGFGEDVRIIYGGSVNSANAGELAAQTDIDGFLIGGASLKPEEFAKIIAISHQ